jgi:hypothetical protein
MQQGKEYGSPRPMVSDSRIIELVDARRQHSLRYNAGLFGRLQSWYNSYRGVWQGRLAQYRNNIAIPFTFAMIQSDVARKVQISFGSWPIVSFEGYAPEDVASAKRNEILISAQMKDADSLTRAVDFFLQADICGTGIARLGWKTIKRMNRVRRMEEVAPGFSVPVMREYDATLFDGPTWEPIAREDFWQQPGKTHIPDMAWVEHRYWADYDDLLEDANSDDPYFDPAAIRQLAQYPLSGTAQGDWIQRRVTFRNEFDYQARQNEQFAKPVEIVEMHGLVPREFAPDGMRNRCIAVGNNRVVLKNREGPLANQMKPFVSYAPMPDPYSFDGVGKAEIAFGPQATANRLNNQKLDALDLIIDPTYIASSTANINTQHLFSRAGRIILVDGPADDTNIRPLIPNMAGFQAAYPEISQLWSFMQLGAGINDIIMGQQAGERETARGFLGRQENVLTRLSLESRLAEEQFLEPLANTFRQLDRQFLTLPHQVKILGSMALVNPITGLPLPQEPVEIGYDDLVPDYRARAVGASQMMGRSVRQQNLVQLLQIMSSNPVMMQMVNWANFARQAFELFDFKNVDELLVQMVPQINQMAQQTGQSPEAVAQQTMNPLQTMEPSLLGSMGNNQPVGVGA